MFWDKQCIYGFSRGGAELHYVDRYEYRNGTLTNVARLSIIGTNENGCEIVDDGYWDL